MYKTATRKRNYLIRDSGSISLVSLPTTVAGNYRSYFTEIVYVPKREHMMDLRLFMVNAVFDEGMIIFQDLRYTKPGEYPPEIMDIMCRMATEEMERFAENAFCDCLLISTDIPLFPEIFLERKYEISEYNLTLSRKQGWQGVIEVP